MHGDGRKSISKISVRQTFYNLKVFWSPVTVSQREALIKNVKKSTQRAAKHLQKFLSINKAHLCTGVQSSSSFFCEMKLVCLVVSMSPFRCFHLKVGWFTRWGWHTWRLMQAKHLKRQVWHNETGKWTLSKCVKLCPMLHFCAVFLMHHWKLTLELKTVVF